MDLLNLCMLISPAEGPVPIEPMGLLDSVTQSLTQNFKASEIQKMARRSNTALRPGSSAPSNLPRGNAGPHTIRHIHSATPGGALSGVCSPSPGGEEYYFISSGRGTVSPVRTASPTHRRAVLQLLEKASSSREQMLQQRQKDEEAATRRKFLENLRVNQRICMWSSIVVATMFGSTINRSVDSYKETAAKMGRLKPLIMLGVRRCARRLRLRALVHKMERPTVEQLWIDNMFRLFSVGHLEDFISRMKPRYFFAKEAIVFKGCQENECFVLCRGTAVSTNSHGHTDTFEAGDVFGVVGMISGEPRSATITASEDGACLAWVGNRGMFESYDVDPEHAEKARNLITEMREKNIRSVYDASLSPDGLRHFGLLQHVASHDLEELVEAGEPKTFGETSLLFSPKVRSSSHAYVLLRGTVTVYVRKLLVPDDGDALDVLMEELSMHVDYSKRKADERFRFVNESRLMEEEGDMKGMIAIAECSAPCLLGFSSIILSDGKGCCMVAKTTIDVWLFHRERVCEAIDVFTLQQFRQNALNIHCRFMKPLTSAALQAVIFADSALDVLKAVRLGSLPLTPWVFGANHQLMFDKEHNYEAYIVVEGSLDNEPPRTVARLWPELDLLYFGCVNTMTVCTTKVCVHRFFRADLVQALQNLKSSKRDLIVKDLSDRFVARTDREPTFVGESVRSPQELEVSETAKPTAGYAKAPAPTRKSSVAALPPQPQQPAASPRTRLASAPAPKAHIKWPVPEPAPLPFVYRPKPPLPKEARSLEAPKKQLPPASVRSGFCGSVIVSTRILRGEGAVHMPECNRFLAEYVAQLSGPLRAARPAMHNEYMPALHKLEPRQTLAERRKHKK